MTSPAIQAQEHAQRWAAQEQAATTMRGRLSAIFCTCVGAAAGHAGCILNITLTGTAAIAGASTNLVPFLYTSTLVLPLLSSAAGWWMVEKARPSHTRAESSHRKWAAAIGCALSVGLTSAYNHHNHVAEYAYLAAQPPQMQQQIKDTAASLNQTPTEYIRTSGLCATRPSWLERTLKSWGYHP